MRMTLLFVAVVSISGCCWMSKRDCFPACLPQKVVVVEKPCDLPPLPPQLNIQTQDENCPPETICFSKATAAALAKHLSELNMWVKQVKTRCGTPVSRPSSRDAG